MTTPILLTGGSGRLGSELRALRDRTPERIPPLVAPPHADLDVTDRSSVAAALERVAPAAVLHAAAYTDVAGAERDREACWRVNVEGTRAVVQETRARGIPLIHISTDYVFEGERGGYREDDPLGPVRNYYALTKLVAEALVRDHPEHLVIRTSFRPRPFPYPTAFGDVFTSQDYVDVVAPEIALALCRRGDIPFATLHIATERKSVFELARRSRTDVREGSRASAPVDLPADISLDVGRWTELKGGWG